MDATEMSEKFFAAINFPAAEPVDSGAEDVWMALRIWVTLSRAHISIAAREQVGLSREGITRGEFGVMDVLFFGGPTLISEIKRKLLVSSGGVTYLVDRLEKKGYVRRKPSKQDRRAVYVSLTPKGQERFTEIFPGHAFDLLRPLDGLSREERTMLRDLLKKVGHRATELLELEQKGQSGV